MFVFRDAYHLLQEDWPKFFGLVGWSRLKDIFTKYLQSSSEAECENLATRIQTNISHNKEWLRYFNNDIHDKKKTFVYCYVEKLEGNLEKHCSLPAEANHLSYCAQIGPTCAEEPEIGVKLMLQRQADIIKERQHQLYTYVCRSYMRSATYEDDFMRQASCRLSSWALDLVASEWSQAKHYLVSEVPNGHKMERHGHDGPPRFILQGQRCDCTKRRSVWIQCRHEIALHAKQFVMDCFHPRWHLRERVGKSFDIGEWAPPSMLVCFPVPGDDGDCDWDDRVGAVVNNELADVGLPVACEGEDKHDDDKTPSPLHRLRPKLLKDRLFLWLQFMLQLLWLQ